VGTMFINHMGYLPMTNNFIGGKNMRKIRKKTFSDLVSENKKELLKDKKAMDKIEDRIEQRAQEKHS
jgi:hypothetical protein